MDKGQNKFYGFYRAQVIGNVDPEQFGRIVVWIPFIMPEISKDEGLLANPANNPVGGRNVEGDQEHIYMGTCMVPKKGAWVWVFFESGNLSNPFYFGALDLENTKVLPECQLGDNPEDKWVVFKSHEGRTIVISDDPNDARIEITGKKRKIKDGPSGDTDSVYEVDGNQTTILLDEREGKEKVLIRTHKGDFLHIDVDQQHLQVQFAGDMMIDIGGTVSLNAGGDIHIKSGGSIFQESSAAQHRKAGGAINEDCGGAHNTKAGGTIARDGASITDQGGSAGSASAASPTVPDGERDT